MRFFDRNDYYSLHGEDAHLAAKIIFKSTATVKTMAPDGTKDAVDYISLSKGNFEILLRDLLLVKNYRVEVYTRKGQSNDWICEFKGSPGNLIQFESLLFSNTEMVVGSSIIAINLKQIGQQKVCWTVLLNRHTHAHCTTTLRNKMKIIFLFQHIGIACIEQNERLFSVIEFEDNDFYTELEATIVLLGPKEAILPSGDGEFANMAKLLERNNIMITIRKKTDFNLEKSDLVQDLNNLLYFEKGQQECANSLPEFKMSLAMSSLNAAIKYLDLVSDECHLNRFKIVLLNLDRFVHLDSAAISALNLLPKASTPINSPAYRLQSILGVLDRCQTSQGHR